MRDLAEVSMNLHPKDRASASPSEEEISTSASNTRRSGITLLGDLSLAFQIALVAYNDDGEVILVLDAQNLLLEGHDLFEALSARYRVDEEETLARSHILFAHG